MLGTNLQDALEIKKVSLTPAALAAALGVTEQTYTVADLEVGDSVVVMPPAVPTLCGIAAAYVKAANTLAICWFSLGAASAAVYAAAAAQTPPAGVYTILVVRA